MAANQKIVFLVFMATVAVALLSEAHAYQYGSEHERKVDGSNGEPTGLHGHPNNHPNASMQGNNTEDANNKNDERKIHWPSSATITIHRASQVDLDSAQQFGPNDPNALNGNRTEGERKFHWPSSMSISFTRTGEALHQGDGNSQKLPNGYKLDGEEATYGFVPRLVSCNYTTQAGRTCADCTHSLLCFSNNLGIKRDCGPQYCDNARCSLQPSAACNATSNE